jgi:cytochrome P450
VDAIRSILATTRTDADFFTRVATRFPRVGYVRLGGEHLYLLSHPELVRLALVEAGRQTMKSRGLQAAKRILGSGLLTSEGDLHREERRLIQPAFHHERVAGYVADVTTAAAECAKRWTVGESVDMAAEMGALTLQVAGRALFGSELAAELSVVREALTELMTAYNRSFILPWFELTLRLRTPLGRRVLAAQARLDAVVDSMIARHDRDSDDLLGAMQRADIGARQLRDESMTLLLAGHETTASALTLAWYLMARRPDIAEWVAAGGDARAVIAESMRLYPPAWVLGRRLTAPVRIDEWTAPAGSTLLVSQWVLHRDGRFWDEPLKFRPQRWIGPAGFDLEAPGQPRLAYFPFGAGGRICVGEAFAWTEAATVLGVLARDWRPRLAPGYELRLRPAITLRPDGPLPMILTPA